MTILVIEVIKRQGTPKGQSRMGNPEKLATLGTQDEDKGNNKHNAICVGHHYTQTNKNNVNKTRARPTNNWR